MLRLMYTAAMSDARSQDQRVADALPGHWVDRHLPVALRPYARLMRLERPIGWWLLLLPCWWGLALGQMAAGGGLPNLWHAALFLIGAVIMRGAGCTLNDIADRSFDAQVARTRSRPLAAAPGQHHGRCDLPDRPVPRRAPGPAAVQLVHRLHRCRVPADRCRLSLHEAHHLLAAGGAGPSLQLGPTVGWTATQGTLALPPILLYLGGVAWTLAYDTIYAHQDKDDDLLIGVKSTALKFGDASLVWLGVFFALALILIDAAVWLAGGSVIAHAGIAGAALHAAWQLARFRADDPARCLELFRSNRIFGLIIAASLFLDCIIT